MFCINNVMTSSSALKDVGRKTLNKIIFDEIMILSKIRVTLSLHFNCL
jgi:hypothetical protein